ncbi:hypothetical protein BRAS3809_5470008 [Bradyrhizobium sp. STM 3809]|nr:hypothetical protein BRAS3809_5470008 [Bradyrhizobium sp. STM 3809]
MRASVAVRPFCPKGSRDLIETLQSRLCAAVDTVSLAAERLAYRHVRTRA